MNESNNNERKNIVEKERKNKNVLKCPNCDEMLTFLMPSGKTLYCNKCEKYYKNDNGNVGVETTSPYTKSNVYY